MPLFVYHTNLIFFAVFFLVLSSDNNILAGVKFCVKFKTTKYVM